MLGAFKKRKKNAFHMLIATILSARAKDETTMPIAEMLLQKYPTPKALAAADQHDVESIIKKTGFYRNKAKMIIKASNQLIENFNSTVPQSSEDLTSLSGVGRKVAGCVRVYAFGLDSIPVDTHVHRIANRLGWVATKNPEKTEQELMKKVPKTHWQLVNDLLVHHGKTVCRPITPQCRSCSITAHCKFYKKNH